MKTQIFSCRSGGIPINKTGVMPISSYTEDKYETTRNGMARYGEMIIACVTTGDVDGEGREIYVTPEGVTFVFKYHRGSPEAFDRGWLLPPAEEIIEGGH